MKFSQLIPVTNDYAVLAVRKDDFSEPCYDHKLDGHNYFWALSDTGDNSTDHIFLVDVDVDGNMHICDRCLVVEKQVCPICGQKMHPHYDGRHTPSSWQTCMGCGYEMNTDCVPEADPFTCPWGRITEK